MKKINVFLILIFLFFTLFFLIQKNNKNIFQLENKFKFLKEKNSFLINIKDKNKNEKNVNVNEELKNEGLILEIIEPKNNAFYNSSLIRIFGKTKTKAEVYINDFKTIANEEGYFFVNYNFDTGENLLTITANDQDGNYAEKEITIFVETDK